MGPEAVAGDPYYDSQEMRGFFKPNVWPQAAPEMRAVWERYYAAMGVLALQLMQIFAEALELPRNWFDDKLSRPASQLVAQHYPALESAPPPDQFRNHAHTDFGNLTILKSEDRPNGLQVLGRDEVWHEVVPVPGTFIVNIGDMLAQWTNDRWHSTNVIGLQIRPTMSERVPGDFPWCSFTNPARTRSSTQSRVASAPSGRRSTPQFARASTWQRSSISFKTT